MAIFRAINASKPTATRQIKTNSGFPSMSLDDRPTSPKPAQTSREQLRIRKLGDLGFTAGLMVWRTLFPHIWSPPTSPLPPLWEFITAFKGLPSHCGGLQLAS